VYRHGVADAVETVIVTDETLPPRKNKKGKVIWCLPDMESAKGGRLVSCNEVGTGILEYILFGTSGSHIFPFFNLLNCCHLSHATASAYPIDSASSFRFTQPAFGSDEKRRMFELYKERKKSRKRSPQKFKAIDGAAPGSQSSEGGDNPGAPPGAPGDSENVYRYFADVADQLDNTPRELGQNLASKPGQWSRGRIKAHTVSPTKDSKAAAVHSTDSVAIGESSKGHDENAAKEGMGTAKASKKKTRKKKKAAAKKKSKDQVNDAAPDADIEDINCETMSAKEQTSSANGDQISESAAVPPPGFHPPTENHTEPKPPDDPQSRDEPQIQYRYLVVPEEMRPSPSVLLPEPSLAVPAAKVFVDQYYSQMTHGLSVQLAEYYAPTAQKSVSVGGAHSVVTGREDITMQVARLTGSRFAVSGVVAHDSSEKGGVFILINGMVQMAAGGIKAFAQSITLTPAKGHADGTGSFLIHNDAIMLLGHDAPIASPHPSPSPLGPGPMQGGPRGAMSGPPGFYR
jgi:hypothetical protein